ncbi:MAG: hypothetical protein J3K34DRAFT_443103 [Monoraphidium minutum]|nr:MAG: hypothetical protein J3K34DRAFT_443103 [Monoraphidium minutum]
MLHGTSAAGGRKVVCKTTHNPGHALAAVWPAVTLERASGCTSGPQPMDRIRIHSNTSPARRALKQQRRSAWPAGRPWPAPLSRRRPGGLAIMRILSLLVLLVAAASAGAESGPACDAAGVAAAALAPPGGLTSEWIQKLSPRWLFFQVLADFAYSKDIASFTSARQDIAPCLKAWGALEVKRFDATSKFGADVNALALRTERDIIVAFRGLDTIRDARFQDLKTAPRYEAFLLGDAAEAYAKGLRVPHTLADGKPNPAAFWVLEGYGASALAVYTPMFDLIKAWSAQMGGSPRVWFTGHSDGSQLAQVVALRYAADASPASIGGVLLFGPSRVGSRGFAQYFNTVLGNVTAAYSYGRDPATEVDYGIDKGLWFPGVGLRACPVESSPVERLVTVPLNGDRMNVCLEVKSQGAILSQFVVTDTPVMDISDPATDHLSTLEYLAHHIPAVTFDGLLRMLNDGQGSAKPDACTLAALRLSQCVVSGKCSAALRPANAQCRTCANSDTCKAVWGMPFGRCDNRWSELSGWQCYNGLVPPTVATLLYGSSGGPRTFSMPDIAGAVRSALNRSMATSHHIGRL